MKYLTPPIFVLCMMFNSLVLAQLNNPNKLPPCPKPDYTKKTDLERISKWNNCWGRYKFEIKSKGSIIEGEMVHGLITGIGSYVNPDGSKYQGSFKNGTRHGKGTSTSPSGDTYNGDWKDDQKHGLGTYHYLADDQYKGDKYVGEYKNDKPSGLGILTKVNGKRFEGIWKDGDLINVNEYVFLNNPNKLPPCSKVNYFQKNDLERIAKWNNCWGRYEIELSASIKGDVLEGEWRNGTLNGKGIYYYLANNQFKGDKYIGEFKDNMPNGLGFYSFNNGEKYVGEFKGSKRNGLGVYYFTNGSRHEGIWKNDKIIHTELILATQDYVPHTSEDRSDIDRERQQLAEERRRLDDEKRQHQQVNSSQRIKLQVTNSQPNSDGLFFIDIKTNADTASLLINGEEQGGKIDGNYKIKKVARVGQDTKFTIVATDINNNTESTTITVARQAVPQSSNQSASLKPENIKRAASRDAVAIIIGIQNYKRVSKADFANNDAKEFYEYAIRGLGIKPENIKLLLDEDADEIEIVKAFQNWLPLQVTKNKTDVFVFYSGHGLPSEDGQSLYFLPYGVDKQFLSRTAVGQKDVVSALQASKPKSVTMFIDSCYSGLSRTGETLLASARPISLKSKDIGYPPEFTVISASSPDQISSSSPELQHGIFSFYLMKGMEGDADINKDGKITAGEMQQYVSEKVQRQAMSMNRKQEPQLIGDANRVLVTR